ncbi:MAG: DUF5615 family PIN-like protein [Pirellulales bacterium]
MKLYFDEDSMDRRLVAALRARNVDIVTVNDAATMGISDERQLEFAASQARLMYSFNVRDFRVIHSHWLRIGRSHAGIVVTRQWQFGIGEQMRRLLHLINAVSAQEMQDRLEFLQDW